jgi:superfamily II DNA or RNA helicase
MSESAEAFRGRGLPFEFALDRAPMSLIRSIVGTPLIGVLGLLDAKLVADGKLRALANEMVDARALLSQSSEREALIDSLTVAKAAELGKAFDVDATPITSLHRRLNRALASADDISQLFLFFGIEPDERALGVRRPTVLDVSAGYALFAHQRSAARRVIELLEAEPRRVLLHMPTGAGKTRTAMHIVCGHLREREPTLVCWLANSPELLDQAAEEFERAWGSLGDRAVPVIRFWGDRSPDLSGVRDGFLVAGFQKMHALFARDPNNLLRLGDRTSLTVADEAHQAIAPTYRTVIDTLAHKHPSGRLLGLSATPGRTWADIEKDAALSAFFGRHKVTLEVEGYPDAVEYLMENEYLARPVFRTLNYEPGTALQAADIAALSAALDIPDSLLEVLGEDEQRNLRIVTAVEDLMTRHRRIVVFAASVKNAHLIRAVLSARGHEAHVVTGEMETGGRERAIRRYRGNAPEPIIMCNYGVLTTGFDAPKTSAAVIARPTRSLVLYSQMVGRATRGPRAGGNETAEIVTVVDPDLPGFGDVAEAFKNWEDVWDGR